MTARISFLLHVKTKFLLLCYIARCLFIEKRSAEDNNKITR